MARADEMDAGASGITILTTAWDAAVAVKKLVQKIRQHDQNARDLEDILVTLNAILDSVKELYGPEEGRPCSQNEQNIRQAVKKVVLRCFVDLKDFEEKLKEFAKPGNVLKTAWQEQLRAPELLRIQRSISERQQHLSWLVQLLQGIQMREVIDMLKELTNKSTIDTPDADSIIKEITAVLIGKADTESPDSPGDPEDDPNNRSVEGEKENECNEEDSLLLRAIEAGDYDRFMLLLRDGDTYLSAKDSKNRNPLLLAASLGKVEMVNALLNYPDKEKPNCNKLMPSDNGATTNESLSPENNDDVKETEPSNHRHIDLHATDKIGRTALHYCAEFDMCKAAAILLDHGVDVDAQDKLGRSPVYVAAKQRKIPATELLLARGARIDMEELPPTHFEIENLVKEASENSPEAQEAAESSAT